MEPLSELNTEFRQKRERETEVLPSSLFFKWGRGVGRRNVVDVTRPSFPAETCCRTKSTPCHSVMQSPVCNVRASSDIQVSSWSLTHWCPTHHSQHLRYSPSNLTVCSIDTTSPTPTYIKCKLPQLWFPVSSSLSCSAPCCSEILVQFNHSLTWQRWLTPTIAYHRCYTVYFIVSVLSDCANQTIHCAMYITSNFASHPPQTAGSSNP